MLFLGFPLIAPSVTALSILVTPISQTVTASPNTNFTLNFKMVFDENADGYFSVTFYWDNNETDPIAKYWNFTYEGFVCEFTDGTDFSVPITVTARKAVPDGYPQGYYRYTYQISEEQGEPYGDQTRHKEFWLNITMRAAGRQGGNFISHVPGCQNITISKVRCYENTAINLGPGNATIQVTSRMEITLIETMDWREVITGQLSHGLSI
jgi:hypothetical protein